MRTFPTTPTFRPYSFLSQISGHSFFHHQIQLHRKMSTFKLPSGRPFAGVEIKLTPDLKEDALLHFRPFKQWLETLDKSLSLQDQKSHPFHKSPYHLRSIDIQTVDFFGGSRIGFIKFKASISNSDGETLPGAVFMRGGSVAMLIILSEKDNPSSDEHVILAVQPRIAAGSLSFVELPAGMIDNGTFGGAAAKEIKEETGLDIKEDELTDMTRLAIELQSSEDKEGGVENHLQQGTFPSPGGSDEFIPIFLVRKQMTKQQIDSMRGKLTGLRDHGEKITLKLVRLKDVWKVGSRDGKTLAAVALYEGLKREGKL